MKTLTKMNSFPTSTTLNPSKCRKQTIANSVIQSFRCSAAPCTTVKSVERQFATLAAKTQDDWAKWRRRNTVFVMSVTVCSVTTTSRGCMREKLKTKKCSWKKWPIILSGRLRRSMSGLISLRAWKINTHKSCKKLSRSKELEISKWMSGSSKWKRWASRIKKWKIGLLSWNRRSTARIKS